ncbi:HTH-type transcriptional repressor ComR [Aquisphaera giovannonii]|uniref:HTH-type transcriptional repressor ComR n=1 Tax=Aquisphaera giovannonii TaxID=406548 RepID=A0A5B9W7M5_9BACT|nr:TetR/AcrR family transcriptional regulator [Aquisphaera giovannonii]QEH36244.1 HTH-type transcriptional repressor ComR [Aquisphaera giovannonii]
MQEPETRTVVLDVAQELIQTRGYNAFSFRDVAERVGIKTASIHYHFPTKTDLCRAVISRQREELAAALARIDAEEDDANRRLARYVSVFRATLEVGNRMCLCGMLAADATTLDPSIVADLRSSLGDHEAWLEALLHRGEEAGVMAASGDLREEARLILSSLEGAMLLARTFDDPGRFDAAALALLSRFRKQTVG